MKAIERRIFRLEQKLRTQHLDINPSPTDLVRQRRRRINRGLRCLALCAYGEGGLRFAMRHATPDARPWRCAGPTRPHDTAGRL